MQAVKRRFFRVTPESKLLMSLAIAFLSISLIVGITYRSTASLISDVKSLVRAHYFGQSLDGLFLELKDAEVAEQKFLLTGKMIHLKFYRERIAQVKNRIQDLQTSPSEDPGTELKLEKLQAIIFQDETFLEQRIKARDDAGLVAAIQFILTGEGARIHEAIDALGEEIQGEQERILVRAAQETGERIVRCLWMLGSSIFVLAAILLASVFLAGKSFNARKQREESLSRASEEAQRNSQAKSDFLATMSHEIRTPMTTVLGMIQLMQRTQLDDEQGKYAKAIKGASHLLLAILNDILDLSKIEAGKLEIEKVPFDPAEAIKNVIDCFEIQAREKGIQLRSDISGMLPERVLGDPLRIRQVLMNLIGNSLKFTKTGSIEIQVQSRLGDILAFSVTDTGIGISERSAQNLFAKFTQAEKDTARNFGGTGLGLSICKQLVELMGGRISVESQPGRGTRFDFTLRAEMCETPIRETSSAAFRPVPQSSPRGEKKILLAEDDPVNRMVILKTLQHLGFSADGVGSGIEVLQALRQSRYAMILMDCRMPDLDGYETTRRIRKGGAGLDPLDPSISNIPIIALTANALKLERDNCLVAGMNDHVSKPIDEESLKATVLKWLGPDIAPSKSIVDLGRVQTLLKLGSDLKDESFARAVVDAYLKESKNRVSKLGAAIKSGDWAVIGGEAHALRSSSANVGVQGLCGVCERLEDLGRLPAGESTLLLPKAAQEYRDMVLIYQVAIQELERALQEEMRQVA